MHSGSEGSRPGSPAAGSERSRSGSPAGSPGSPNTLVTTAATTGGSPRLGSSVSVDQCVVGAGFPFRLTTHMSHKFNAVFQNFIRQFATFGDTIVERNRREEVSGVPVRLQEVTGMYLRQYLLVLV